MNKKYCAFIMLICCYASMNSMISSLMKSLNKAPNYVEIANQQSEVKSFLKNSVKHTKDGEKECYEGTKTICARKSYFLTKKPTITLLTQEKNELISILSYPGRLYYDKQEQLKEQTEPLTNMYAFFDTVLADQDEKECEVKFNGFDSTLISHGHKLADTELNLFCGHGNTIRQFKEPFNAEQISGLMIPEATKMSDEYKD